MKRVTIRYIPFFSQSESKIVVRCVTCNDFTYKARTIIVVHIGETFPTFGEIRNIYILNKRVYFEYNALHVIGFNNHYFAYSVQKDSSLCCISYDLLPTRIPCILDEKEGCTFIATRCRL